jgi:enamine deaminase RidA (YjgF/YER057c/UK114 family)
MRVAVSGDVSTEIDKRLADLGLELPEPAAPGANYVPFVQTGNLLFVTGQLPRWNGERRFIGKLGRELGVEDGQEAARLCAGSEDAEGEAAGEEGQEVAARVVRSSARVADGSSLSPARATRIRSQPER